MPPEFQEPVLASPPPAAAPAAAPAPATPPPSQANGGTNATPPATPPTPAAAPATPTQPTTPPVFTGLPPVQQSENKAQVDAYLNQAGLSMEHVTLELKHSGKLSDVSRNLLVAKHGANASLVEQVIMANHTQMQFEDTQKQQTAHAFIAQQFGVDADKGGQAMSELVSWAVTNVDKTRMAEYADIIDRGGLTAELALKSLVDEYRSKANVSPDLVNGDTTVVTNNGDYLTREEYNTQRFEIEHKHGYDSPQMVALQQRRNLAISKGY